jgi:hypothetical protein
VIDWVEIQRGGALLNNRRMAFVHVVSILLFRFLLLERNGQAAMDMEGMFTAVNRATS